MSTEGNRNNPYTFDDYLRVRDGFDYYRDDAFLQALLKRYTGDEFEKLDAELKALSDQVSYRYRDMADEAGRLENRLRCTTMDHFDGLNHRVDRLRRCMETVTMEREIFDLGLFDPKRNNAWSRFAKMFLLAQNSEFGVMCPVACTHGSVALMEKYESDREFLGPEALKWLSFLRDGQDSADGRDSADGQDDGTGRRYSIAAQYLTEIQGGSDVPSNLVEAVYEEAEGADGVSGCFRLYGKKFFCSATQADVALVTAKPKGTPSADRVAVFAVPAYLPGAEARGVRNGYTIDRLKQKLGTAELPTAEITFDGAVAYPVGPLEKGLADVVGIVLTLSRLHVALGLAAGGLRVAREATWYAQFRTAFGVPVDQFPLMMNQINDLNECARRTAAGLFKIHAEYVELGEELVAGFSELERVEDLEERRRKFRLRELILLQKIVISDEAPAMTRMAISFFGGHGIMEDFTVLPRFLRDSMIMELWEGPRNVLLTQIHRDFSRAQSWYPADAVCRDLLSGADGREVDRLASELNHVMSHPSLLSPDPETLSVCRHWQRLSNELFTAYQRKALAELGYSEEPPRFQDLLQASR